MSIKFIVDSASDITPAEAKEMGVTVVPLKTIFGEEEYLDGLTLDYKGFYEKLYEYGEKPKTAQISPYIFGEEFKKELALGNDVICIDLSKLVSGCYQSACVAKQELGADNIHVIDSKTVAMSERALVQLGIKLANEGKSANEIADILTKKADDLRLIVLLENLDYLTSGGRISKEDAAGNNANGVRPIIALEEGKVAMKGKARGTKAAYDLLNQLIEESGGIDFDLPYSVGFGGLSDELAKKYMEANKEFFNATSIDEIPLYPIACTIGAHLGPNTIAVGFFAKNKNN